MNEPSPRTLSLDIETFSSADLSRCGVYRYAESPDFRILLVGYSLDDGPVKTVDLTSGDMLPEELIHAILSPSVEKWAFNAAFERICLSRYLRDLGYLLPPRAYLPPTSWRCSMIWCAYMGLPMSLAGAGTVLGLDKQKLETGKKLITYFCRPASPTILNGQQNRNLPDADPERWKAFAAYNRRDVETELEIRQRLSKCPVPDSVWQEYELDQKINDRGIGVDLKFVRAAIDVDNASREELTKELSRLTEIANPNSTAQIRRWLKDHGQEVETLSKKEVRRLLDRTMGDEAGTEDIRGVLLLRQQLAKSSVKKYQVMVHSACWDGRVRGMFQFYGAQRSGRWAGRNVQLQNLPQNHMEELDNVRAIAAAGEYSTLKMLYDSVPDVLSELIRTAFVPSPGKKFIVSDFSAIEARVIAWLAGERWRMEAFAEGKDIYCASASKMFHVPVEKHGVNGHLRDKGKIAELALGYGGGVGALKAMGALDMELEENELQPLVNAWRRSNRNIVRLWWDVDRAVKTAIRNKTSVPLFNLRFIFRAGMLFIQLPSGRRLCYAKPRIGMNRFGGESVFYKGCGEARKWETIESYGPKFVENIVQGISRDLLCVAMRNLSGYAIVGHVHDEVILEADKDVRIQEITEKMAAIPNWATGLLLRADGYECATYRKA